MVSKEKLIKKLDNAAALEDKGAKLISGLLLARIEKSSLPADRKKRLMEIAETIREESGEHRHGTKRLIETIRGLEQDEL